MGTVVVVPALGVFCPEGTVRVGVALTPLVEDKTVRNHPHSALAYEEKKASIRQAQNHMKEINRQRQAIRDYRRTKEIYTQFRKSGWSAKFYQEHRTEIEAHKKTQAVYELHDGKLPTLKELTAEYDTLKGQLGAYKPDLIELKSKLTDLKHIRYNYKILTREIPQTDQYHRKGDRIECLP